MESYQPRLPPEEPKKERRSWKFWAAWAAAILLIILIAQNSQKVEVNFLFSETKTPLIFALAIAGLLGVVIGWAGPKVWRARQRD